MIIDCIADLHGFLPELAGGDLLIVAGDLTARDEKKQYVEFTDWYLSQKYTKKVLVAGNHDNCIQNGDYYFNHEWLGYLCDSGTEFEGLKIWGSPWTKTFPGMNPKCKAFTFDEEYDLVQKWRLIPHDTNILITHSPSFGNFDWIKNPDGSIGESVGSETLWMKILFTVPHLKLHVTGHIHEAYGQAKHPNGVHLVNASHVNEKYKPVNKPIRIIL